MSATCPRCGRQVRMAAAVFIAHGQADGLPCPGSNINPQKVRAAEGEGMEQEDPQTTEQRRCQVVLGHEDEGGQHQCVLPAGHQRAHEARWSQVSQVPWMRRG